MDELEAIRARKMQQLQAQQLQEQQAQLQQEQQMQEALKQIDSLVARFLTPEAQSRLSNLKLVEPELVQKLKIYFAQLAAAGRMQKMDDAQLKDILLKLKGGGRREIRIKRQ